MELFKRAFFASALSRFSGSLILMTSNNDGGDPFAFCVIFFFLYHGLGRSEEEIKVFFWVVGGPNIEGNLPEVKENKK